MLALHDMVDRGFGGDIETNDDYILAYATDASIYRELPLGVVFPKDAKDMQVLVRYASEFGHTIIPRGAGTSLAGQCVGDGIVMDVSRYMNNGHVDDETGVAIVQPGIVRDELNRRLQNTPWFFGPNTSTSNRATIGGMVGNNSSGTTSIAYGVTRDKLLALKIVLADGTLAEITAEGLHVIAKGNGDIIEQLTNYVTSLTTDDALLAAINANFPHPAIHRRSTGYALDLFVEEFNNGRTNWLPILCGSEGTLGLIYEITIQLDKKPPPFANIIVSHFHSVNAALEVVPSILAFDGIFKLELMDDTIINCARESETVAAKLFFIAGEPTALLLTEVRGRTQAELEFNVRNVTSKTEEAYEHILVPANQMADVWYVRAAGLGILSNIPGDEQALACIEDTAVHPKDLSQYIQAFSSMMQLHDQQAVYYAHAGAGELHLRPILNLKTERGRRDFKSICKASAELVKQFNGSLSGEHGDGRVRAPFIADFYGEKIYQSFVQLKQAFDPNGIFNPNKIVEPKDLLDDIRVDKLPNKAANTFYSYEPDESLFYLAERCNGSADCRKSHDLSPGMCPTYQASGEEIMTTRARANLVREALTDAHEAFPLAQDSLFYSMSTCIACKACQTQCPSGVDVALMKSEYYRQKRLAGKTQFRDYAMAHPMALKKWLDRIPFSRSLANTWGSGLVKQIMGVVSHRKLPLPARRAVSEDFPIHIEGRQAKVILLLDEFVNYFDQSVARSAIKLLRRMDYSITILAFNSGRALISKGFLEEAEALAQKELAKIKAVYERAKFIIGIEPSALLSISDEYRRFKEVDQAQLAAIDSKSLLIDEFLLQHIVELKKVVPAIAEDHYVFHSHCHQKALAEPLAFVKLFNQYTGVLCEHVNTGCCGMAGSFGYESEHQELSRDIANLGLLPVVKSNPQARLIAAGMSCRHQIRDLSDRPVYHPVEILADAVG